MSEINTELREQVEALFTGNPPVPASFADDTEVTVTLTKGQALTIRSYVRRDADEYLRKIEFAQSFGQDLAEHADDINESLANMLAIEAVFDAVAPDSDYELMSEDDARQLAGV